MSPKNLWQKKINSPFVNDFNGDDSFDNTPRQTQGQLYSLTDPTQVKSPSLEAWSDFMQTKLGLNPASSEDIEILSGNMTTNKMTPYSTCYGGFQFGHWAGQLGDGRAINLGEIQDISNNPWELQLKGAGPTAYSRSADGRAVWRSSVREYLMSEAMFYLGIPTTRVLSLCKTGDSVMRDMLYDGNPANEQGAIVSRLAPSFLRFGHYQILAARTEFDNLEKLINWTMKKYYPQVKENKVQWFQEICARTIETVIHWCRVGFTHGVLNTDNMSILGLTIDYGPFSMLDAFDTTFTPNTTDLPGRRYAFGKQPGIIHWNLSRLADSIKPILTQDKIDEINTILEESKIIIRTQYNQMMSRKLAVKIQEIHSFEFMIQQLHIVLENHQFDMTIFYTTLQKWRETNSLSLESLQIFQEACYLDFNVEIIKNLKQWLKLYQSFEFESINIMKISNPQLTLRNFHLYQAIEDKDYFNEVYEAIKTPYKVRDEHRHFVCKKPDWAKEKIGCSSLSCSS